MSSWFRELGVLVLLCMLSLPAVQAQDRPQQPDAEDLEAILRCLGDGLPPNWKKTWVIVSEVASEEYGMRNFQAKFFFSTRFEDTAGERLVPCDEREIAERVYGLNKYLPTFDLRQWREAKLVFTEEGRFDLSYDYSR